MSRPRLHGNPRVKKIRPQRLPPDRDPDKMKFRRWLKAQFTERLAAVLHEVEDRPIGDLR